MKICEVPWRSVLILANGNCHNCCYQDATLPLGNVNDSPGEQVWNGAAAQEIRAAWLRGEVPPACKTGEGQCMALGRK